MFRVAFRGVRLLCMTLMLVLVGGVVQPHLASAATPFSLTKSATDINTGQSSVATGTLSTRVNDTVTYTLQYSINSNPTGGNVTISDYLNPGQTYISCSGAPCAPSGGTVNFTLTNPAPGSGSVSINVQMNGTSASFTNVGSISQPLGYTCPTNYNPNPSDSSQCLGAPTCPGTGTYDSAAHTCTEPVNINGTCTGAPTYQRSVTTPGFCTATPTCTYGTFSASGGACVYPATPTGTTSYNSNTVQIYVSGTPPPPGPPYPGPYTGFNLVKSLEDVTRGGPYYDSSAYVAPGERVRYRLVLTNGTGANLTNVIITDQLQGGQTFANTCTGDPCAYTSNNSIQFTIASLPSGYSATETFDAFIPSTAANATSISNTATANGGIVSTTSNTTQAVVSSPTYTPYPVYTPPYYPGTIPVVAGSFFGTLTVCGVLSGYTAATASGYGYMTINGEQYTLMPSMVPGGSPFTIGTSYCVTLVVNASGFVSSATFQPNVASVGYVCGNVSQYTPGWYPYSGYAPYQGYTSTPSYSPYNGYGPYTWVSSNGTQTYNLNTSGWYGWGGPMVIGGYPYPVATTTAFPYAINYGSPYCFLQAPTAQITGSLSVVPTLATSVDDPVANVRLGHGHAA